MQAVILAAGLGTRMGELTKRTPKPLLKIGDQNLLERNLENLPPEIKEVVLVIGYLGGQIRKHFGNKWRGRTIRYVEQKEPKGTAHALFICQELLEDRFLVLMGDDLYDQKDLREMAAKPSAVLVWEMKDDNAKDSQAGVVKVNEQGELLDIIERQPTPKGTLVNCGAYVLSTDFFKYPLRSAGQPANEFGLPQTMLQMVRKGAKFSVVKARWWHKVAAPEDLKIADNQS
ncbi:MAG: hypothetical protein A3K06_02640 [Candidatus Doudnabacteria bacterium RIFCSPHIGHO2_01_52_17]|uniref:Nucleotidyl transferase domain-containing protein n=1 Tax=Candidatus Doudnabacteria bacterium RIFCSPHIGHO2_01_52_17 TaxID=1817820 RepID=A0A1F5NFE9_9BACT|nr:MAG: Nucleotidyl transferase [Parcubacteria group bacterium GW2011_GWA2_52_8]OGE76386.1 MAG: hypothetical protein A3K06_02640 [Candidatus Doudnabacteria bacterium RIFCSPHIGHO2_01_52_17]